MAAKHVYEIYVRTTPEALWEALIDPDTTATYFSPTHVTTEVVEADAPSRLVVMWSHTFDDGVTEGPSRVTWEIEPVGATCRLRLVHDDFHGVTRMFGIAGAGWPVVLSGLKTLLETGDALTIEAPSPPAETADIDAIEHQEWGRRSNQRVWALIADGAPNDDVARREVVNAAHASQWHWSNGGGTALNEQRGEWLISHVYALLGDGPLAVRHARRCWEITEAEGFTDFDLAYGYEGLARAYAVAGDSAAATEWRERAEKAGALIADDEDRAIFESDLASA